MIRVATATRPRLPRLEYRLAFDLAAAALRDCDDGESPLLLVVSLPALVEEARVRWPVVAVMDDVPAPSADGSALADRRWIGATYRKGMWAAPQSVTWRARLEAIDAVLADGALLGILTAGPWAWLLALFRSALASGEPRWPIAGLGGELARRRFRVAHAYGLGGVESALWAALGRLSARAGRDDLADRCEAAYRLALAAPRAPRLAAFSLLVFRKDLGSRWP